MTLVTDTSLSFTFNRFSSFQNIVMIGFINYKCDDIVTGNVCCRTKTILSNVERNK